MAEQWCERLYNQQSIGGGANAPVIYATGQQIGSVKSSQVTFKRHGNSWLTTRSGG